MNDKQAYNEAAFCGTIPLHFINTIQPHGVLVVAEINSLNIVQASGNAAAAFGMSSELPGLSLKDLYDVDSFNMLADSKHQFQTGIPATLVSSGGKKMPSIIHEKDGCLFIESENPEFFKNSEGDINRLFQGVQHLMSAINRAGSIREVAAIAAREIRRLSGFDKVMIYCFDEEWVGTVIAEEMKEGMDRYLGLRFPSTDIPKTARELYLRNPYRIIPNRDYAPVPLVPAINPLTKKESDMSDCKFRGVMNVHLEYLKNMDVVASMSTRIINKEKLWGLIACHHTTPKYLSFNQCAFFEFVSAVVSARVSSITDRDAAEREQQLLSHYHDIMETILHLDAPETRFETIKHQLSLVLEADGVAACRDGKIFASGLTPDEDEISALIDWLSRSNITETTQFQALSYHYEPAKQFADKASGLLVLPIQPYDRVYVLAFRPEVIKNVSWGGDPSKVLTFDPDKTNYHPRNSFKIWKEVVRYTAEPWKKVEMDVAEKLRIAFVEFALKRITQEQK